jgi:acetyl esterase/lipase
VQDAQRAMSIVRSRAGEWKLDPQRIGILGFSAGGETAALTTCFGEDRQYEPVDDVDKVSSTPNFAVLVYPAYLVQKDNATLQEYIKITAKTPPMFFAHAQNDPIHCGNSVQMALALKNAGVPAELHLYSEGGHGFGLRKTDDPCTSWPQRCQDWLTRSGWLAKSPSK